MKLDEDEENDCEYQNEINTIMRKSSKSLNQNDEEEEQENAQPLFVSQSLKQSTALRVFI